MKILIWGLNIIQFLIVYFLVFYLFFSGLLEAIDPSVGLTGRGLWPAISIGLAGIPWKYYNRFSLFITSKREEPLKPIENKDLNINKEVKQSKSTIPSKNGKILVIIIIIISSILIIPVFYISYNSYYDYKNSLDQNPESEYFDFSFTPISNENTVKVDDVRYLKHDMSLFSGKRTGNYGEGYEENYNLNDYYELNYLDGKLNGNYYAWRSMGSTRSSNMINVGWNIRAYYKDGKLEGLREYWYSNDQLKSRANYKNDLKQGDWKEWDVNGKLVKHWVMKDGIAIKKTVN